MIELTTTIRRLPQRLHESFQFLAIKPHEVMA
jgi:hypothetical protein